MFFISLTDAYIYISVELKDAIQLYYNNLNILHCMKK